MELNICHLYPDALNLYGDRGNILCMTKRLQWRGIDAVVTGLPLGQSASLSGFDLFFIGGGQDFEQGALLCDLASGKAADIRAAVEDGKVFLAICGGYQILGSYYRSHDGTQCDFIGALDLYTLGHKERLIGNCLFRCAGDSGGMEVVGFENHSGRTFLGENVSPLGIVVSGHGNNGEDGTEGARYLNVFGSYAHGPVLPKNPRLADMLLQTALERKYGEAELPPLDDGLENGAHEYMVKRLA